MCVCILLQQEICATALTCPDSLNVCVRNEDYMDTFTSTALLEGLLEQQNAKAWQQFNQLYRPMVVAFARKLGLSEVDAEDAAQETLIAFVRAYRDGAYDRTKGRLRSWVFGIAHKKVLDIRRRWGREMVLADKTQGTAYMESLMSPEDMEKQLWEPEYHRAVLRICLDMVRPQVQEKTFRAFELVVFEGLSGNEAAEQLDMTANAVFIAKNRILAKVRVLRKQIEEQ